MESIPLHFSWDDGSLLQLFCYFVDFGLKRCSCFFSYTFMLYIFNSRFALDIDLHAPKVRIPIRTGASSTYDSQFLLDFGHFTLHTKVYFHIILWSPFLHQLHLFFFGSIPLQETNPVDEGQSLYSRFYISGRDIAASFTDCGSDSQSNILSSSSSDSQLSLFPDAVNFYSIIDRCGMSVIVDQVYQPDSLFIYVWSRFMYIIQC